MTILLVDDRKENLIVLEEILEQEGRTFITASSGNEALKILLKNNQIGLIMLDVQMPEMDGFEVARILKSNAKTKDISIIFVTAINKDEQYVLKGFEEGAVDYLQKPLDIHVTRAKVSVFEQLYYYQQQLKDSLARAEHIKSQLERFVYTVSHDLKSPLSGITLIINSMIYDLSTGDTQDFAQRLSIAEGASLHLSKMVDSILEYSRTSYEQQKKEQVDVGLLIKEIFRLLFPPANFSLQFSNTLPVILTRKLKLQQVFQNLISNAIKYNDKTQGIIDIASEEKENSYIFSVKDNGPGISDHDKNSIFELFSRGNTTSERESSTGVGLNLLKMTVEEQGGKIWVESIPGESSTFFFEWYK